MTLRACGTMVLNLPLTLCAELHARRRIPASVRRKPKWRTVLPAMVLCSNQEGMLPDFSKSVAAGSSAGAGFKSGLLELTVCLCWVIDSVRSPPGCIVTGEGGDCWCVPQSHPPLLIHTHTHLWGVSMAFICWAHSTTHSLTFSSIKDFSLQLVCLWVCMSVLVWDCVRLTGPSTRTWGTPIMANSLKRVLVQGGQWMIEYIRWTVRQHKPRFIHWFDPVESTVSLYFIITDRSTVYLRPLLTTAHYVSSRRASSLTFLAKQLHLQGHRRKLGRGGGVGVESDYNKSASNTCHCMRRAKGSTRSSEPHLTQGMWTKTYSWIKLPKNYATTA